MAEDVSLGLLSLLLVFLLFLSACFSGSETALLSLNRYRLRHRARQGHLGARLAERLLARPDRLISLILIGNNIANTMATALVTVVALRIGGPAGVAIASVALAFVIMVFAEVMPKTVGAMRSEQVGLPAAVIYYFLLKVTLPLVWLVSQISNGLLALMGIRADQNNQQNLTLDELRPLVSDSGALLPRRRQRMLMAILELGEMTVDEIMIPDNELAGIDLEDDWSGIMDTIMNGNHSRLPVYRNTIENLVGLLHVRRLVDVAGRPLDRAGIESRMSEPFFVPEGASVHNLLVQLHRTGQRTAFVVDEYGDIQGMVTMEDILEEILGEFSGSPDPAGADVRTEEGGASWLVNAGMSVRALNRMMGWQLPTSGPTTLNGLILEQMESIPAQGTIVRLNDYAVEILETADNTVRTVRVRQPETPRLDTE
ncbi:MAG: HlyC/CorC family transporter [Gammaproteobacteria bacterium]|nr:HlyC/CorC family transporter [Gammaproteobacteria bacterium]